MVPTYMTLAINVLIGYMAMTTLPSTTTMYQALVDRNSEFEGVFFVGVRTTGIFCRPTCPSKKPKPENVEFFPSPKEALYAGYRPCLRCQPLDRDKKAPELVTRLRQMVDESPTGKITDGDLRELRIDPVDRPSPVPRVLRHDVSGVSSGAAHGAGAA